MIFCNTKSIEDHSIASLRTPADVIIGTDLLRFDWNHNALNINLQTMQDLHAWRGMFS